MGSLPIVLLTGIFSGAIIALQMVRALNTYGAGSQVGTIVSLTLVRELGPVLTALLVAGRNASGIASELGSMKVTEQIDAMRALGTDPMQKLVTPRLIATALMLPCLTARCGCHRIVRRLSYLGTAFARHKRKPILVERVAGAGDERFGARFGKTVYFRNDHRSGRLHVWSSN